METELGTIGLNEGFDKGYVSSYLISSYFINQDSGLVGISVWSPYLIYIMFVLWQYVKFRKKIGRHTFLSTFYVHPHVLGIF